MADADSLSFIKNKIKAGFSSEARFDFVFYE
jgi:hypothetical protein